jgi:hypothetical protein
MPPKSLKKMFLSYKTDKKLEEELHPKGAEVKVAVMLFLNYKL